LQVRGILVTRAANLREKRKQQQQLSLAERRIRVAMEETILCFESGGTKLVAMLFDADGSVLGREVLKRSAGQTARETVEMLCAAGKGLLEGFPRPAAVGWGFGGTVDRDTGNPLYCFHETGWGSFDAAENVRREFKDIPVFVENDCNMGAMAEAWNGEEEPPGMLFFATLGTGIGGGIVRNGVLMQLSREGEGEIGHLVVKPEGCECACGNRGCLECYCSGPGMVNLSRLVTGKARDSFQVMEGFRDGDPECRLILEKGSDFLGAALAPVINILAPDEIVLGGGLIWNSPGYLDMIERKARSLAFPVLREKVTFRLSSLGGDLVCRGAFHYAAWSLGRLQP